MLPSARAAFSCGSESNATTGIRSLALLSLTARAAPTPEGLLSANTPSMARLGGALDRGFGGAGGVRAHDDRLEAARDRVLPELDLLVDVGLRGGPERAPLDAEVVAGVLGPRQHDLPERRVAGLDDDVDLGA